MKLKLINKEFLVDNIWTFRFEADESLDWIGGQFIRVELGHEHPDEEGTMRWFTISSAPYEKVIEITTRVTGSTFKQALASLETGGVMQLVDKPDGDFIWEDSDRSVVFIAGGIGITPFHSILKQRVNDHLPLGVTLIYSGRNNVLAFRSQIDKWSEQDPKLKVNYSVGKPVNVESLSEFVPNINSKVVYISGPEPMVESLGKQLKDAGLSENQLKQDFFPHYDETNY
jgi:ferredoxin-NADP reductase